MRILTRLLLGTFVCSIAGCATTSPASHRDVDTIVRERVGVSPRLEAAPANAPSVEQATRTLIDGELDAQRAVEVALLNNATLRGRIEELGIAQAEVLQARLIANAKAHASFRFPRAAEPKEPARKPESTWSSWTSSRGHSRSGSRPASSSRPSCA